MPGNIGSIRAACLSIEGQYPKDSRGLSVVCNCFYPGGNPRTPAPYNKDPVHACAKPPTQQYIITYMMDQTIFTRQVPPTIQDVMTYFQEKGIPGQEAEAFFLVHEKRQWSTRKGKSLMEWKSAARRWIASVIRHGPRLFDQRLQSSSLSSLYQPECNGYRNTVG